ncbi:thiamine pyrophosphate-dependent enzyme [Robiginitomaculum antarcticum]|uniref:thiamine pyrophosphate-dependent enzyme n=1 Tax=Robiginitomaculum antarcticum TaxID=437507 RepID=UPI00037261B5
MFNRADAVDTAFSERLKSGKLPVIGTSDMPAYMVADLFETMLMNRHLDLLARRSKGETFYSIGSSGHEVMASVAAAARRDDMAFLHYRDANFCIQRRRHIPGAGALYDMLLSFVASSEDPVSGGRHKVLGGLDIFVPPQTSTIASHLPKAMGMAHAVGITKPLGHDGVVPHDSVVLCSFGDASANHSTAQGAINAAAWAAYQGSPMPIVYICEDNGVGISVDTPDGWIATSYKNRPGLDYIYADGRDPVSAFNTISAAIAQCRRSRRPVFLHLSTVRLMGHAGADIETAYRNLAQIEALEATDPLITMAAHLIKSGHNADGILAQYEAMRDRVERAAKRAFKAPKLSGYDAIAAPIIPPKAFHREPMPSVKLPKAKSGKLTLAASLNQALMDVMATYPQALIFGEDVGKKGGVYGITKGVQKQFGPRRVFDTLLDEQTIFGTAIGVGHQDFLPVPEIQFLAYLHNALDQIRGEASTLSFFSKGQFTNPMVVRIAGLAYQRGFGGHFHNDNSITALRDIPGVITVCPSSAADAPALLREALRLAHEERRVVIFVEPIALYQAADIEESDGAWTSEFDRKNKIKFGDIGQHENGKELAILTYGNGYYLSHQAAKNIKAKHRIIDLRWLSPLPMEAILKAVKGCKNILIVDECRETGSLSEELMSKLIEAGVNANIERHCAGDSFIALGTAAYDTLPSAETIAAAANKLATL